MVYEHLPETVLRPLLSEERGVYYEDAQAPTALLVANKRIYLEVKAWFDTDTRLKMPATVVICPKGRRTELGTQFTILLIDHVWKWDVVQPFLGPQPNRPNGFRTFNPPVHEHGECTAAALRT
jgi:hypothetical protein